MKKIVITGILFLFAYCIKAQTDGVQIDYSVTPPARSNTAILQLNSSAQGFLPPRVALLANNNSTLPVASPVDGLIVYNTATAGTAPNNVNPGLYFWNGTVSLWQKVSAGTALGYIENQNSADQSANFRIKGSGLITAGLTNTSTRPAVAAGTLTNGELRGYSNSGLASDDGFLRISAGGGTTAGTKSYIDLSGYANAVPDMLQNIVLGTSGSERMRITSNGNVGIGYTAPIARLHVIAAGASDQFVARFAQTNTTNGNSTFIGLGTENAAWSKAAIGFQRTGAYDVGDITFNLNANAASGTDVSESDEKVRITNGGYVGIGTTAPTTNLHVTGASSFDNTYGINLVNGANDYGRTQLRLTGRIQAGNDGWAMSGRNNILFAANANTAGVGVGSVGTDKFAIQYQMLDDKLGILSSTGGSTPLMVFQQNGNVGIGSATPGYKLDVVGNTKTSGKYFGHLNVDDTRSVNTAPTGYNNEVAFDFKFLSTISAPGSGNYGGLITMAPWGDNSGDASHQLFFNEGGIYWRQGQPDAAAWDSWSQVLTTAAGGAGTTNYLARWTGANTLGIGATRDDGTLVGIGIASTGAKLHIDVPADNDNDPADNGIYVYNTANTGDNDDAIITTRVGGASAGDPFFSMDIAGVTGWSMGIDNSDADKLKFANSWSDPATNTRMTIETGGNVGIGNTIPNSKFHVTGSTSGMTDYGILTIGEANGNNSTQRGISFGWDATNEWAWIYARTVGCCGRAININNSLYINSSGNAEARNGLRTERQYTYFSARRNADGSAYDYSLGNWDFCAKAGQQIRIGDDTFDGGGDGDRFVAECWIELNDQWPILGSSPTTNSWTTNSAYNSRPTWYLYMYNNSAYYDRHMYESCMAVCVNFDY